MPSRRDNNRRSQMPSTGSIGSLGSLDPFLLSDLDDDENQQVISEIFEASISITGDSSYSGRRLQTFRENRVNQREQVRGRRRSTHRRNMSNDATTNNRHNDSRSMSHSESGSSYEDIVDLESLQQVLNDSLSVTGDASYSGRRLQTFRARREERMRAESADRAGGRSASSNERLRDPTDRRLAFHNSRRGSRRSIRIQELEEAARLASEHPQEERGTSKASTSARRISDSGIDRPTSNISSPAAA